MSERRQGGEVRAEGRRLAGTVMAYGEVSPSHRERFEPGSLRLAEAVPLNLFHDPLRAVAWQPGGGLEIREEGGALIMRAELPPIPAADVVLAEIRGGRIGGLSVEFNAERERREDGLRVIEKAVLSGIGIVRSPSYTGSRVEARARSGMSLRARIPTKRDLACRCSGVNCRKARFTDEAVEKMLAEAFALTAPRDVVATWVDYRAPLASVSRGTLRRSGADGVEIDLPTGAAGEAVMAARDNAGIVVRPHIDASAATATELGGVAEYSRAPVRAFVISATDEREGWPEPDLVATPDNLPAPSLVRRRDRRQRVWL